MFEKLCSVVDESEGEINGNLNEEITWHLESLEHKLHLYFPEWHRRSCAWTKCVFSFPWCSQHFWWSRLILGSAERFLVIQLTSWKFADSILVLYVSVISQCLHASILSFTSICLYRSRWECIFNASSFDNQNKHIINVTKSMRLVLMKT